jgi:hypothetical protein
LVREIDVSISSIFSAPWAQLLREELIRCLVVAENCIAPGAYFVGRSRFVFWRSGFCRFPRTGYARREGAVSTEYFERSRFHIQSTNRASVWGSMHLPLYWRMFVFPEKMTTLAEKQKLLCIFVQCIDTFFRGRNSVAVTREVHWPFSKL